MAARYPSSYETDNDEDLSSDEDDSYIDEDINDDGDINNEHSGYDVDPVEQNIKNEFTCVICACIVRDAVETECHHLFCRLCLSSWEQEERNGRQRITCPICNKVYSPDKVHNAGFINRMILSAACYCKEKKEGCTWKGSIADFEEHYKCCPFIIISCPNKRCKEKRIEKSQLDKHLEKCSFQEVDCPYKDVGCNIKITRQELNKHTNDFLHQHNKLLRKELEKTRKELEVYTVLSNDERVENFFERLNWFVDAVDNYETSFKNLLCYMETDKAYLIRDIYYFKIGTKCWYRERLCVKLFNGSVPDKYKECQPFHRSDNVYICGYNYGSNIYVFLRTGEGWKDNNTKRFILHPKIYHKVGGHAVEEDVYRQYVCDGSILVQVHRK